LGFLLSIARAILEIILIVFGVLLLITLFELPLRLLALIIGPLHPEFVQVYTLIEMGIILCLLIFGLPNAHARYRDWFKKRWVK